MRDAIMLIRLSVHKWFDINENTDAHIGNTAEKSKRTDKSDRYRNYFANGFTPVLYIYIALFYNTDIYTNQYFSFDCCAIPV